MAMSDNDTDTVFGIIAHGTTVNRTATETVAWTAMAMEPATLRVRAPFRVERHRSRG